MVETPAKGAPVLNFMGQGDYVRIWMEDAEGRDLFGPISQKVETI